MKRPSVLFQLSILFLLAGIWTPAIGAYDLAPSTGADLPYSVQFKNNLKNLRHNASFIGGQVIALRDTPGKEYSGNYIDVGDLGGVKRGDVFALFSPDGDPVGFIKITEVQRYTSSFEFLELTVNPSDNLEAKKVTNDIRDRLPSMLLTHPDMRRYHHEIRLARAKQTRALMSVPQPEMSNASASALPPLPGQSSAVLPPLPGASPADSTSSGLPPLPGAADNSASMPSNNNLPPLPGAASDSNLVAPPLPQNVPASASGSPSGLPSLPGDNNAGMISGALPPVPSVTGSDSSNGSLPPLPTDNANPAALPPLSTTNPVAVPASPDANLPALPTDNAGVPPQPTSPDSGMPALPSGSTAPSTTPDNSLPSLPGMDNSSPAGLPPLPQSELPGSSPEPVAQSSLPVAPDADFNGLPVDNSEAALPSPGMDSNSALPGMDLPAPQPDLASLPESDSSIESGLPALPEDDSSILPTPGDQANAVLPDASGYELPVPDQMADSTMATLPSPDALAATSTDSTFYTLPTPDGLPGETSPAIADTNLTGLPNPTDTGIPAIPDDSMAAIPGIVPQPMDNGIPQVPSDLNTAELPPSLQNETLPPASTDIAMGSGAFLPPPVVDNALPPAGLDGLPQNSNGNLVPPMPVVSAEVSNIPGVDDFEVPGVANPSGVASSAEAMNLGLPPVPSRVNGRFLQDIPTFTSQSVKPAA